MTQDVSAAAEHLQDASPAAVSSALAEHRRTLQQRLLAGATGEETVGAMTDLVDGLIVGRYRTAARAGGDAYTTAGFQHCCLVALGGYGRRELAPYSDIDLMMLYRSEAAKIVPDLKASCFRTVRLSRCNVPVFRPRAIHCRMSGSDIVRRFPVRLIEGGRRDQTPDGDDARR